MLLLLLVPLLLDEELVAPPTPSSTTDLPPQPNANKTAMAITLVLVEKRQCMLAACPDTSEMSTSFTHERSARPRYWNTLGGGSGGGMPVLWAAQAPSGSPQPQRLPPKSLKENGLDGSWYSLSAAI